MDMVAVPVTKGEAAERQLNQAIRLFFERGDPLAVHTLTGAAFQILADLGAREGQVSRIRSDGWIRPERAREWHNALNHTQNFLKHADRDPGATLQYVAEGTVLFVLEAVEFAEQVIALKSREALAFKLWFAAAYPELIEPEMLRTLQEANTQRIDQTDRDLWAEWLASALDGGGTN